MAFLEAAEHGNRRERFSLLLLEPNEIYFEDFSAFYFIPGRSDEEAIRKRLRGRIKLCSHSVIFDPHSVEYPILKFPFKEINKIEESHLGAFSRSEYRGHTFFMEVQQVIEMKGGSTIAPFVFERGLKKHVFFLNHSRLDDCLPHIHQLKRASTLPFGDQISMISAIVQSRQARTRFDKTCFDDLYEKIILETQGDRITPLVLCPGKIVLTSTRLYFQSFNNIDPAHPVWKIKLSDVKTVTKRRFLLRHVGIEIFCPQNKALSHLYLKFAEQEMRDEFHDKLLEQPCLNLDDPGQENMTLRWQNGLISNYDYLMYLNSMGDRTFNDLTQYPVFPWILADYTSKTLDLGNPETFRDLSKPVGALNESRLQVLKERYEDMPSPRFLYGSHYSNPGFVLFYLARAAPEYLLCLHNGRFDQPDRMFNSIPDVWRCCLTGSDYKELIPEFFQTEPLGDGEGWEPGAFLHNSKGINYGVRQDGRSVNHVELPPWAKDPADFVRQHREALESEYVTEHLPDWIDLVFGYKQTGEEAEKANNVFYYLTYEGAVDLDSISDPNQRASIRVQIMEFGQIPRKVFLSPHPRRFRRLSMSVPTLQLGTEHERRPEVEESSASSAPCATLDDEKAVARDKGKTVLLREPEKLRPFHNHSLHKEAVQDVKFSASGDQLFSVSQDTTLKSYSPSDKKQIRSFNMSTLALSSCLPIPGTATVAVGCWDDYIYFYSVEYGRVVEAIKAHDDAVSGLAWRTGHLISASWDSTVKRNHPCFPVCPGCCKDIKNVPESCRHEMA